MKDGKIYTPESIVNVMISDFDIQNLKILEPSCGDGNFVVKLLNAKELVAQDIDQEALDKMKSRCGFQGKNEDFLSSNINEKFDLIIGNPPYIRIQDLDEDVRNQVKKFDTCKSGSVDIYYAFIEHAIKKLNKNGVLRFIIPNAWLINSSAKKLRGFLSKFDTEVFDFGNEKVFENVGTYTCILTVRNSNNNKTIKVSSKKDFFELDKKTAEKEIWANKPNSKYDFTFENGLATLCDKVFIFEKKENGKYFSRATNSFVEIEDEFIKPIIKGSTLEEQWCLYPYDNNGNKKKPIGKAFNYLNSVKNLLENRDYDDEWWNFGRSQGIKSMQGKKLVISNIISPNGLFKSKEVDCLVYSGVFVKENFDEARRFMEDDNVKNYILKHGKKMSGGYCSFSKTMLKGIIN